MMDQSNQPQPLRLFWWKGVPNFGDALSPIVVAHVSGRQIVHSGVGGADLLAVGSVIQIARRKFADASRVAGRTQIWGSGLLHYVPRDFLAHVDVALVRGPVTAALLGLSAPAGFGDPGLLIAEALGTRPDRGDTIGIVPHHTQINDDALLALAQTNPRIRIIDPREETTSVCRQIGSCAHVYAASLHGLITSDAYGVGSTWIDPGSQSHLKYHDYAASVGRTMIAPLTWADIPSHIATLKDPAPLAHADGIARAQSALRQSFPASLHASTHTGANVGAT